ncbi:MAG: enoyl-CoA hydratase/isomerase family protein [Anaerolineae bacterium]|nr:enoyl-CoA hydratase/isomerase family protein [Anaerolineae bacterium]
MNQEIILTQQEGIATLRVNRPEARNALNWTAQAAFAEAVAQVAADSAVRVLIISGTGDKAFVSGGDLKELSQHPEREAGERLNRVMREALGQLTRLPIPVIAAVNGDAFGGGCEILTACDLRVATRHARFCFAQVRNALCTGWGGTGRLVNLLGQARALDLLLTARIFSAEEAQQMGLVQQVVDEAAGLETAVTALAHSLIQLPQHALAASKQLVYAASQPAVAATNAQETSLFVDLWSQPDHLEALAAFREKRKPVFGKR